MRPFTKQETKAVVIIFAVIILLSLFNFSLALRRSRDAQRKSDMGDLVEGLNLYKEHFGYFPQASEDGRILACATDNTQQFVDDFQEFGKYDHGLYLESLRPCDWANDSLSDLFHEESTPFMDRIPHDPIQDKGILYIYQSSGKHFHILSHLEGEATEDEYNIDVEKRNVSCGNKVCNYARSSKNTPVSVSIKEYEERLKLEELEKQRLQNE